MISIDRSRATEPPGLSADGAEDLRTNIAPKRRNRSLVSKDFKKSIYGPDPVRDQLWAMQHHKCCFCEHPYERKNSTVEHFRPKTKARRTTGRRVWGYWWLGYTFENLYFCCTNCNSVKSDWFPVTGAGLRPRRVPWTTPPAEAAVLIDPGFEDPSNHITFVLDQAGRPRITHLDDRGKRMIEVARLDRDDLDELREQHYFDKILPTIQRWQTGNATLREAARQDAVRLVADRCPYALMARVLLAGAGVPV